MPPIFKCPPTGYGGEIFSWDLAEGLGELGVEVHLFAIPGSGVPKGGYLHYVPSCQLETFSLFEQSPIKFYKHMIFDSEFVWHDFLHSHIIHDFLHWNGKSNVISTPWGSWIMRPVYRDNLVCWSKFHRELALRQGYPESTRYVHGCTNTDLYCPDKDKPFEKEDYFLFMARMHPDKRPDIFLRLAEAFPDEHFVLAGSFGKTGTPDHAAYGKLYADEAAKLSNVIVEPDVSVADKIYLMRHARALIHPSVGECFGLSIVEALACGTNVIVSRDGAFPEIVIEGKTGFLCETFEQYVNAVKNVDVLSPERARKDAVERFSRACSARGYLKIYEEVQKRSYGFTPKTS